MSRLLRFVAPFAAALGLLVAPAAEAQLTTFAQFFQSVGGSPFSYTSTGTAGSGGSASLSGTNVPIIFQYLSISNLPADLAGLQSAHLTFTSFSTMGPTSEGLGFNQFFDGSGVNAAMITITRDTPAAEGTGSQTILLQVLFTPFTLGGSGGSGGFSASSLSGTVTFMSDFLTFPSSVQRDLGLTFSSIVPSLGINATSGFFNNFTAAGTGTFSSNPVPTFIPEPSSYAMLTAVAVLGLAGLARRRRVSGHA